jgi:hypothetical protein
LKYLKTYFWIDKYLMGADSNATPWLWCTYWREYFVNIQWSQLQSKSFVVRIDADASLLLKITLYRYPIGHCLWRWPAVVD